MLVHHADPGRDRITGSAEMLLFAVDENPALICRVQAIEDVHQSRLASTVLTEQTENLPRASGQVYRIVGKDAGKSLRDPPQLQLQDGLLRPTPEIGAA